MSGGGSLGTLRERIRRFIGRRLGSLALYVAGEDKTLVASLGERALDRVVDALGAKAVPLIAKGARRLEESRLVHLQSELWFAPRMDYARHEVLLRVTGKAELPRLHSAAKEPWTIEWIETCLRPGDVLYDIGANVGAYSLVAAKHAGGAACIYAFEPAFDTFAALCRNVVLNKCGGCIFPLAVPLAARTGPVRFRYSSIAAGAALHGLANGTESPPADEQPAEYEQLMRGWALDDAVERFGLERPTHVKIDVDGLEASVVGGARRTLEDPGLKTLLLELNEDESPAAKEVIGRLEAAGLKRAARIQERSDTGGMRPAYWFFAREPGALGRIAEQGALQRA